MERSPKGVTIIERRLGIVMPNIGSASLAEVVEIARTADNLGYSLALVPEAMGPDALVVLAHLAGQVQRIQLGTGIINVFSRSPAAIGMAVATLDEIAGGRTILGLGTSGPAVIEGWHGIPNERPLQRLRETMAVVRKVLQRERSPFEGECFRLAPGFALRFRPKRSNVPIYLASLSRPSVRLVGEAADGWLPYLMPLSAYPTALGWLEEGLQQAGRSRQDVTVAPYILAHVADDPEAARAPIKAQIAFYIGAMGTFYHRWVSQHGYAAAADRIRATWAENKPREAAELVPDALVDEVAVWGPAERCRERLDAFRRAGADMPVLYIPHSLNTEQYLATLKALAGC